MERVFFDTTVESTQNFIKAFLKEIKPNGICREGGFSFLNTDLPYTGQVVKGEDFDEREEGFTFDQFDYWEGAVSFLEYESCTGSIVRIYITRNEYIIGYFENVGATTYERFIEACKAIFPEGEMPPFFVPAEATRPEDRKEIVAMLKEVTWQQESAHCNLWHPHWVEIA